MEIAYSDNGKEFRGNSEHHAFTKLCKEQKIEQKFTKGRNPKSNGKAERVIRTIMEMWHDTKNLNPRLIENRTKTIPQLL
ncbi:hypothetical protein DRQ12_09395 [candidate division KSB1 bacterium]|nr:MAG: hypothetical protein DRQ12_09395 [candidate division KSB1 bacterium]RKY83570.1 MAG: hypothetical protein DRQ11_12845 [candidate division KSB1 bacterium]